MLNNLNESKQKIPRYLYAIVFILIALIVITGILVFSSSLKSKTGNNSSIFKKTFSNLDISASILSWIDSQKQTDLSYSAGCRLSNGQCPGEAFNYRIIPYIVWGKFNYFNKTGDQNVLSSIESDLDQLNGIQYSFWNCKLLYDIQLSSTASDSLKAKAKSGCQNGAYEVFLKDKYLAHAVLESNIKTEIGKILIGLVEPDQSLSETEKNNLISNYIRYSSYVSEVYINDLWGIKLQANSDLKDEAQQTFYLVLKAYPLLPNESIQNDFILGIASIDLYKMTKNSVYLDLARHLYIKNKDVPITSINYLTYDFLFLKEFSTITGKDYVSTEKFTQDVSSISNQYFNSTLGAFGVNNFFSTSDNALMVGILSQ